jgi:phage protein D
LPVDLLVELRLNRVSTARLTFFHPTDHSVPSAGDPVEVSLGVDGDVQKVFTGLAESIRLDLRGLTVYAESRFSALAQGRINKVYEKQKAGEIVRDLADQTGVDTSTIEDGIQFPVYALSDRESLLDHVLQLAWRNGYDCYADADDKLVFAPHADQSVHALEHGANLLAIQLTQAGPRISGVEVYGESPSSLGQGPDVYSWLTKKDVKGAAGSSSATMRRVSDPAVKDLDTAGAVADAIFRQLAGEGSGPRSGRARILGSAAVALGHAVQVQGSPGGSMDGRFKITGVKHRLNKRQGFVTTVTYAEV